MFERFRKSDRGREEERTAVVEDRATAVADRDDEAATTVHERETTVHDRDDAPATTTLRARDDATATTVAPPATTVRDRDDAPATTVRERDDAPDTTVREPEDRMAPRDRFARDYAAEPRTLAPVVGDETLVAMHDRQRIRFGGVSWGSAFFGLLSAIGLAAILLGIVAAAGVAIGVSEIKDVT